ncbi:MAG: Re/Si-specific NAD(P)(+) transhydrogenase subunit alpha [Balneolaceae bacterium]
MNIHICKETQELEKRVALTPDIAASLLKDGVTIRVESTAGLAAGYPDEAYKASGVEISSDRETLLKDADLLLAVNAPSNEEIAKLKQGSTLICYLWGLQHPERIDALKNAGVTAVGLEAVPRISRAQSMDALSSMSNIAGYKSVLIAGNLLNRYMPMMMTAAGTIRPANFLILGAGVAGLQAIATAKRLGAVVEAYDIRPVVKEQVESLGAKFVDIPLEEENTETEGGYAKEVSEKNQEIQKQVLHTHAAKADVVITTALIPGKPAPKLLMSKTVAEMKPGAVIVDLAAEQGGNCELTSPGKTITTENGVVIDGPLNLASTLAFHASQLYAKNLKSLLGLILKEGTLTFDFDDEILKQATLTHNGEITSPLLTSKN